LDFDSIFEAHWTRIYTIIFLIVGDHAEAEDLALETFVRLHQRPPRAKTNIPGWLFRVATNLSLNALRTQKRRRQYEEQAGKVILKAKATTNPSVYVENAEEIQRVRQVLIRMKKRSAKILLLRHADFSYAEIAESIGVSPASVGSLLARAEREFERRYKALEGN